MINEIALHYNRLIDENDDPVCDPPALRAHMDKWDGKIFLSALQADKRKSALEIGVGTGRLAVKTAPLFGSFTGIDLSEKTLERAKTHLAQYAPRLICADFLVFPFAQAFDVVYSSLTFFHIKDKRAAFEKVFSLLKPHGRFVLSTDKSQNTKLVCGDRTIPLYPDEPTATQNLLLSLGFSIERTETEFAHIFIATKNG